MKTQLELEGKTALTAAGRSCSFWAPSHRGGGTRCGRREIDGGYITTGAHRFRFDSHAIRHRGLEGRQHIPRWLIARLASPGVVLRRQPVFVASPEA